MFYLITEQNARSMKRFIDFEVGSFLIAGELTQSRFLLSVNKSELPRKFCVELTYLDKQSNNVIQLSSISFSDRRRATLFANAIYKSNPNFINKLNF